MNRSTFLLALGLVFSATLAAHDGEVRGPVNEPVAAEPAASVRPRHAPDGALLVDKALQHRLGLRTEAWSPSAAGLREVVLSGEVVARPDAAQSVIAGEAGRLEALESGWPVAGRQVRRGEVLAWLRPALGQRERAERRAQIADLEQKLVISDLTVERMRLQREGAEDTAAQGNVYYEQSRAENEAMVAQRRLLLDSLEARQPLRAPADGRLAAVRVAAGEVATAGQALFELAAPGALRIVAISFDPQLAADLRAARLQRGGPALAFRGSEPLADAPGWRLLFDLPASAALQAGQLAELRLSVADRAGLPAQACVLDAQGRAQVWLHEAAERFVPRSVGDCLQSRFSTPAGARLVTAGAARLAGY